jgi:hypothetical protein
MDKEYKLPGFGSDPSREDISHDREEMKYFSKLTSLEHE